MQNLEFAITFSVASCTCMLALCLVAFFLEKPNKNLDK